MCDGADVVLIIEQEDPEALRYPMGMAFSAVASISHVAKSRGMSSKGSIFSKKVSRTNGLA